MLNNDLKEYEQIVGNFEQYEYLGPERQGELLRRCTILEDVEIGYSSNTHLNSSHSVD